MSMRMFYERRGLGDCSMRTKEILKKPNGQWQHVFLFHDLFVVLLK